MKAENFTIMFFHNDGKRTDIPKGTTCVIKDENGFERARVQARLYYKDKFNKKKGRKEALKKALEAAGVPRELRKHIWTVYKNNFKL